MKKFGILLIALVPLLCGMSAHAEDCMKISQNGIVKQAKDIGAGKGISFTLPEFEDDNFYIYASELAVFEKKEDESEWHIYKDSNGNESKRIYKENLNSLNIQADFGDFSDYRERAKYKIGYRYYVSSIYDLSEVCIAGEDKKEGWRLIGEEDSTTASDDGFVFYINNAPTVELESIEYYIHTTDGLSVMSLSEENLSTVYLPKDAFKNGVKLNLYTEDFDKEDILSVSYVLKNKSTDEIICQSAVDGSSVIYADTDAEKLQIQFTVRDNFGAYGKTKWYDINIDNESAKVIEEFDDKGFSVKGLYIFSDFIIDDNEAERMISGVVSADIERNDGFLERTILTHEGNGRYRLHVKMTSDGSYKITLHMFDSSGNESSHVFYQRLDNTKPTYKMLTSADDTNATDYKRWMNVSKNMIVQAEDELSGVSKIKVYEDGKSKDMFFNENNQELFRISCPITTVKTGKIRYHGYIYDNAKELDMNNNTVKELSVGNSVTFSNYVWIDKTPPEISISHNENEWFDKSYTVEAEFNDYPSSAGVEDASGVKSKQYALTHTDVTPDIWIAYTNPIEFPEGGVYYLHLKATDYAGNETVITTKIKINEKLEIAGNVVPTDGYMHTIYYSEDKFYVVKNTAYNTNYHFYVEEKDTDDVIRCDIKLINEDDNSIYSEASSISLPNGKITRDVVFNALYTDSENKKLPDGLYTMYITLTEIKSDGEEIITYNDAEACEVVIKRTVPPAPIIDVSGNNVAIEYPEETLAASLNTPKIKERYKREYKAVKSGQSSTNVYKTYEAPFEADDFIVTALYTDIAGNISSAVKRVFKDDFADRENDIDALTDGNNAAVEESRPANVYYVGIRREKQKGINSDIFKFIN